MVVFELENLNELDLKYTKINNLPENNLKNLETLHLDYNFFDTFKDANLVKMSHSLKCLTISHNLLKEIPFEINQLENLEILDLSFNKIEALPNEFKIHRLKELYLDNNNIHHLNSSLSQFKKSMVKLSLEKNQLMDLTFDIYDGLFDLVNLKYLNLSYNNLVKIPPGICALKSLANAHSYEKLDKTGLWVIGNPLHIPPKEIWQTQSVEKIFGYLSMYNQRNSDYVYYAKLVFLGESGVGKSRLVDSFFDVRNKIPFEDTFGKLLLNRALDDFE
jgi:Leucine-rich repeat (LRR) protein